MKKSLFAVAAITAFAGAAQAQSSVTVYGIMDGSYTATENNTKATAAAAVTKVTGRNTVNGDGALSTSRIGFRGVEDLGGGQKAEFMLEYDLVNIGNGGNGNDISVADVATNTNVASTGTQSGFGARYSWIGISDAKLGTLRLGRQEQAVFTVLSSGLAGAGNNIAGSVYSAGNTGSSPIAASVRPVTVFLNQAITYISPKFAGFTATTQHSSNAYSASGTTQSAGARESGASLNYDGIKNLTLGYGIALQDVNITAVTAAAASGTSDTVVGVAAASNKVTQQAAVATYNFGFATGFANFTKNSTRAAGVSTRDQTAYELGLRAPLNPTIGVWASAFVGNKTMAADAATLSATTSGRADISGFQLGTTYAFSKRTTAYAIYGSQEVKGKSLASGTKIDSTGYAVGLRHSF